MSILFYLCQMFAEVFNQSTYYIVADHQQMELTHEQSVHHLHFGQTI